MKIKLIQITRRYNTGINYVQITKKYSPIDKKFEIQVILKQVHRIPARRKI